MALKRDDDHGGLSSYYNDKSTITQEARVFNESPVSPRKCRALLTRIAYLLYIGESFGQQEATTLFFGTTKLFQNKDVSGFIVHFERMSCFLIRGLGVALVERVETDGVFGD